MISGVIFTVNILASSSLSEPEPDPDSEPDSEPEPEPDSEPEPDLEPEPPDLGLDVCFFECVEGTDAAGVEIHSTSASRISLYFESNEIEAPIMNKYVSKYFLYLFDTYQTRRRFIPFIPLIQILNH